MISGRASSRPTVLILTTYFAPGYKAGGPVRSVGNIVQQLGADFQFYIVTLDRDLGDSGPYREVLRDKWLQHGWAHVLYMAPEAITVLRLVQIVRQIQPDTIYLNSFFDYHFTLRMLAARWLGMIGRCRVVLAPRGEFSTGALRLKRVKKRVFLVFARAIGLYKGVVWHASTVREAEELRAAFPASRRGRVHIARNLAVPTLPDGIVKRDEPLGERAAGVLRVCFLSRISPKKNLDFALRSLSNVTASVCFTVYGPKEVESYWEKCRAIADGLPSNISVQFVGPVPPDEVSDRLQSHDVFLLPTMGENYGHVIFEALAAGLYVIISDQTPWQDLSEKGVGKVLPLADKERYADAIDSAARWGEAEWSRLRALAVDYAARIGADEQALAAHKRMFVQDETGSMLSRRQDVTS